MHLRKNKQEEAEIILSGILTEKEMGYRRILDKTLAKMSIEIQPVLEVGRTDIITELLCHNDDKISYLPDFVTKEKIKSGENNGRQLLSTKPNIKAVDNAKLTSAFEENECKIEIWRKDDGEVEKVITRTYKDEIVLEEHYVKHSSDVLRKEMHYVWILNENGNYDIVIDGRDKELFWYSNIVQKDKNEGQ